jgi:hypothetical protein
MMCACRDISTVAAIVHTELLVPMNAGSAPSDAESFGYLGKCLRVLLDFIGVLSRTLSTDEIVDIESGGYPLVISIGLVRQWCANLSLFAGRCQAVWLQACAMVLDTAAEKTESAGPRWQACIQGDHMDVELGAKLVNGKLKAVVKHHNDLHSLLASLNTMAGELNITPVVQKHDITSKSVAVALDGLRRAAESAVVIRGLQILESCKTDPQGPKLAEAFIKETKEQHSGLPDCFWNELEVAAGSLGTSTAGTITGGKGVKRQLIATKQGETASASASGSEGRMQQSPSVAKASPKQSGKASSNSGSDAASSAPQPKSASKKLRKM